MGPIICGDRNIETTADLVRHPQFKIGANEDIETLRRFRTFEQVDPGHMVTAMIFLP